MINNKKAAVASGGRYDLLTPALYPVVCRLLRTNPRRRCPVCGKPDWCSAADDGSFAICMRIAEGAVKTTRNGGYLHILHESPRPLCHERRAFIPLSGPNRHDLSLLAANYRTAVNPERLDRLARNLGLSVASLQRLGIGWAFDHNAWSFPMTDASGRVLGIRLRRENGRKFAIEGGHDGLFIPTGLAQNRPLLITEGPTDCAALLDLGFAAVGRPSCRGGVGLLVELLGKLRPAEVIIFADNDAPKEDGRRPGIEGAETLAASLVAYCPSLRLVLPPGNIKDARAWRQAGATSADVQAAIDAAPVRRLLITTKGGKKAVRRGK